jgi:DNA-binding transcriptional regulator YdaS (Cro superfamily)
MELREVIEAAATRLGSQRAVAAALDINETHLSNYKQGKTPCSLTRQAQICELAGMTEGEQMRYVWEVVRARMGKPTGAALGVVAWIASTIGVFAQLAESLGSATMYKPTPR